MIRSFGGLLLLCSLAAASCPTGYSEIGPAMANLCPTGTSIFNGFCCQPTAPASCPSGYGTIGPAIDSLCPTGTSPINGFCCQPAQATSPAPTECKDSPTPQIACNLVTRSMCADPAWIKLLTEDCPQTCGFCGGSPAPTCHDPGMQIPCETVTQSQCQNPLWKDLLTQNCPRTCGFCSV